MMDFELMKNIEVLCEEYERNWGIPVDMLVLPKGLTQEKFYIVLKRIVETGESVLVGYGKIFNCS